MDNIEPQTAFIVEPWWTPPLITIKEDRMRAEQQHNKIISNQAAPLAIYTDGSRIHGKVGAAIVAPAVNLQDSAYLGKETAANIYTAELVRILMGLHIAVKSQRHRVMIFTDNQAALKTLWAPRQQSGQFITKEIVKMLAILASLSIDVELY